MCRSFFEANNTSDTVDNPSGNIKVRYQTFEDSDDGDFLLSYYCSDNMLLKVEAHSEECVDSARQFVDELGLPK